MWSQVMPTREWIEDLVPEVVNRFWRKIAYRVKTSDDMDNDNDTDWWENVVDAESVCQVIQINQNYFKYNV